MPSIQFSNIAKEPVTAEVISISGKVLEINRSNQTHLHASGGRAYASSHSNSYGSHATASVSPISVTSSNSVHDDVHLLTDSGEEVFLQLVNWENAGIRQGHMIQAIWLQVKNPKSSFATSYVVVNNRSLNRVLYNDNQLATVVKPSSFAKVFTAYGNILGPITKIVLPIIVFFCLITIILAPVVGVIAVGLTNFLKTKLPGIANSEVKPKLQPFLLPPVNNKQ